MRVVHICEQFVTGGIESLVVDLSRALEHHGVNCQIVNLYGYNGRCSRSEESLLPVIPLGMNRRLRVGTGGLWRLRRVLAANRPDVLHCHGYYAALAALLLRTTGISIPILYTVHADLCRGIKHSDFVVERVARRCEKVVAVSYRTAAAVSDFTRGAVHPDVVLNGAEHSRLAAGHHCTKREKRAQLGIPERSLVLLTVAGLNSQKDHPTLLRAFAESVSDLGDACLLVVGDGPCRAQLQELAARLGLNGRVQFMGFRSDVNELLIAADIFVLASHNEGLSISIIEACSAGLPVVATLAGLSDLPSLGIPVLLTEPGDVRGLCNAFTALLDPLKREALGRVAKERATSLFSIERTAEGYLALYQELMLDVTRRGA
jgi:glycosyltransferase involved in cell wall biosynthesis